MCWLYVCCVFGVCVGCVGGCVCICVCYVCVCGGGGERELVVIFTPLRLLGIVVVCGMEGWG